MIAQLIKYHDEYYLSLEAGALKALSKQEARLFLKNYASESFYNFSEATSSVSINIDESVVMAAVEDNGELRICSPDLLNDVFSNDSFPYLTTGEFAEKHNKKLSIVLRLCRDGRLEGALQVNSVWLIPEDTPYPADARFGLRVPSARSRAKLE